MYSSLEMIAARSPAVCASYSIVMFSNALSRYVMKNTVPFLSGMRSCMMSEITRSGCRTHAHTHTTHTHTDKRVRIPVPHQQHSSTTPRKASKTQTQRRNSATTYSLGSFGGKKALLGHLLVADLGQVNAHDSDLAPSALVHLDHLPLLVRRRTQQVVTKLSGTGGVCLHLLFPCWLFTACDSHFRRVRVCPCATSPHAP